MMIKQTKSFATKQIDYVKVIENFMYALDIESKKRQPNMEFLRGLHFTLRTIQKNALDNQSVYTACEEASIKIAKFMDGWINSVFKLQLNNTNNDILEISDNIQQIVINVSSGSQHNTLTIYYRNMQSHTYVYEHDSLIIQDYTEITGRISDV